MDAFVRYYDPVAGRFLSVDPVLTDENTGASFNRYVYVNNNPYKYVDPDGRAAKAAIGTGVFIFIFVPESRKIVKNFIEQVGRDLDRFRNWIKNEQNAPPVEGTNSAPPIPEDYVGDQSRGHTSNGGKRHTSGPLTPENGGTGDAEKDFDKLTGGTGKPFPDSDGRSKKPGTLVGDNGIWIRPGTKNPGDGPRIEIPGNGNKLPETLHY